MSDDPMLTVPEVAARLRLSEETVRRWLRQGALRGRLMGGTRGGYRVLQSEVERFIADGPAGKAPLAIAG